MGNGAALEADAELSRDLLQFTQNSGHRLSLSPRTSPRRANHLSVTENEIAHQILDSAYRVHSKLGPGLFESVYEAALAYELAQRGLNVSRQFPIPVIYESIQIEAGFRADLLVEGKVIVELKFIEAITPVHHKQLLTYLRLSNTRLGLLLNFNVPRLKEGITRLVSHLPEG
mgnify:CR=1 FL=1